MGTTTTIERPSAWMNWQHLDEVRLFGERLDYLIGDREVPTEGRATEQAIIDRLVKKDGPGKGEKHARNRIALIYRWADYYANRS